MKIYFILIMLLLGSLLSFSQSITIDRKSLTHEQLAKYQADSIAEQSMNQLKTVGAWAGIGKEIGIAVKEGLTSVVDVANKFSTTKVGEITLYIIIWKLVGKDFVNILIGLLVMFIFSFFSYKYYKTLTVNKIMVKGSKWKPWKDREYKIITPDDFDGIEFVKVVIVLLQFVIGALVYAIFLK